MRNYVGAFLALLIFVAASIPSASAAGWSRCADTVSISENASIQVDDIVDAGAFIKPDAPVRALVDRSEEPPRLIGGADGGERRGSRPFSPTSLVSDEPAPPSASVRRACLHVYRL